MLMLNLKSMIYHPFTDPELFSHSTCSKGKMSCRLSDDPNLPPIPKFPVPDPICANNKIYTDCKKACVKSCMYPNGEPGCQQLEQASCKPGCECPAGMYCLHTGVLYT